MTGILAQKVFRIGIQTLWYQEIAHRRCYYVSIENRSYRSFVKIPPSRVDAWIEALT